MSKRRKFYLAIAVGSFILGVGIYGFSSWFLGHEIFKPWWATLLTGGGTMLFSLFVALLTDVSSYHYGIYGENWLDER